MVINTYQDLISALAELFDEIELDANEIDTVLLEAGYDPITIGEQFATNVEALLNKYACLLESVE